MEQSPRKLAVSKLVRRMRPLGLSLALVCMAVGAPIVLGTLLLLVVPMAFGLGLVLVWLVAALLLGWAGIEALAALERWMENDRRFHS